MPPTFQSVWTDTVKRNPDARALVNAATGQSWTRAELAVEAEAWREDLPAGINLRGLAVVFSQPNGIEWWRVFLGLVSAGAVPAALDPGENAASQQAAAAALRSPWIWREGQLIPANHLEPPRRTRRVGLYKLTSGSTGVPRAFAFNPEQMIADGRHICRSMGIGPDDVNYAVIPFGHSYGWGNLVIPLLLQGTAVVVASSALPHAMAQNCARQRPTVFPAVPALLRLLNRSEIDAAHLSSLRLVISAGAPLTAEIAQQFAEKFGRRIHGFYGSSETGGISYDRSGDASLTGRSVGRPLDGVTLKFRRGHRFSVHSAAVMGRGFYSPPDRAMLNAQGEVTLLGRTGRHVKVGGHRVDLGEIETALRQLPGVTDAFVISHPQQSEALAAAVATTLTRREIQTALAARLSAWKIPRRILPLAAFPLTARGKTDTRAVRQQLQGA